MGKPRAAVSGDRVPVVSWDRLTLRVEERRGVVIEGYELQRSVNNANAFGSPVLLGASESSYRDTNVSASVSYYYRIRAYGEGRNGEGFSPASDRVHIEGRDDGCDIGLLADRNGACQEVGASCPATGADPLDRKEWRERNGVANCECPAGWAFLDPRASKYCARQGLGAAAESAELENPPNVRGVQQLCATGGYDSLVEPFHDLSGNVILGWESRCGMASRRSTASGLEEVRPHCVVAAQYHREDTRRLNGGFLRGEAHCHDVFPAGANAIPRGHDLDNPYIYGECPGGQYLDRDLNRCVRDCTSAEYGNLGQGVVAGLTLIARDSAETDNCECPVDMPLLDGTECVADCPAGKTEQAGEDGVVSCLETFSIDTGNVGMNCGPSDNRGAQIKGTYGGGDLVALCPVERDIYSADAETVYTSGNCWLSASPGFLENQPPPTDPDYIPPCEDLAVEEVNNGVTMTVLRSDLSESGNEPIEYGECPPGKVRKCMNPDPSDSDNCLEYARDCKCPNQSDN